MINTLRQMFNGKKERRYIPLNRRKVVWHRDGKRCRYGIACDQKDKLPIDKFHLDHIKPVYYHGSDYNHNLCVACPKCNLKRGKKEYIRPDKLPGWRKVYGFFLILWYLDFPRPIDFF